MDLCQRNCFETYIHTCKLTSTNITPHKQRQMPGKTSCSTAPTPPHRFPLSLLSPPSRLFISTQISTQRPTIHGKRTRFLQILRQLSARVERRELGLCMLSWRLEPTTQRRNQHLSPRLRFRCSTLWRIEPTLADRRLLVRLQDPYKCLQLPTTTLPRHPRSPHAQAAV
jgi:hypothetical protein